MEGVGTTLQTSEKQLVMCCRASSNRVRTQLSANSSSVIVINEFLNGFHVCEKMPKVEQTAICSETDADAIWQGVFCCCLFGWVFFCLMELLHSKIALTSSAEGHSLWYLELVMFSHVLCLLTAIGTEVQSLWSNTKELAEMFSGSRIHL